MCGTPGWKGLEQRVRAGPGGAHAPPLLPEAKPAGQAQKTGCLLLRSRASPPTRWACTPTTGARLLTDVTRAWTYGRDVTATQGMQLDNKNRSHNDKSCFFLEEGNICSEPTPRTRVHTCTHTRMCTNTHTLRSTAPGNPPSPHMWRETSEHCKIILGNGYQFHSLPVLTEKNLP